MEQPDLHEIAFSNWYVDGPGKNGELMSRDADADLERYFEASGRTFQTTA